MKGGGSGGGNTITGLTFEKKVDFRELITAISGYELRKISHKAGLGLFFENKLVACCFRKQSLSSF